MGNFWIEPLSVFESAMINRPQYPVLDHGDDAYPDVKPFDTGEEIQDYS